jgi:hypothetical protein
MLVVLEIIPAKVLIFTHFSLRDQLDEPIADDMGEDIQCAGQIVNGNKLHAAILLRNSIVTKRRKRGIQDEAVAN